MNRHRLSTLLTGTVLALLVVLGLAGPAQASTLDEKLALMSDWTQGNATSYNGWDNARTHQGSYAAYGFDWSTDYCSASPDQPLGFDFRMPCWHHDWGYRNYKAVGQFPANKSRIDSTFYYDLKQVCLRYSAWVRPSCYSLAWTYYQAVKNFGSLQVSTADLDDAARLKAAGLREAAMAGE